jgi:hypothetical protein
MRYQPPRYRGIGERFDVRGFIPPRALVDIARDRTNGMVDAYLWLGARTAHLQILANSCYMQGLNDAIDAMHKAGLEVVPRER